MSDSHSPHRTPRFHRSVPWNVHGHNQFSPVLPGWCDWASWNPVCLWFQQQNRCAWLCPHRTQSPSRDCIFQQVWKYRIHLAALHRLPHHGSYRGRRQNHAHCLNRKSNGHTDAAVLSWRSYRVFPSRSAQWKCPYRNVHPEYCRWYAGWWPLPFRHWWGQLLLGWTLPGYP